MMKMLQKVVWKNIIFTLLIFVPIFALTGFSRAATREELLMEIAEVYAKIDYLQEKIDYLRWRAEPYDGVPKGFLFTKNLRYGDESEEVKYLQLVLNEEKIPYVKCLVNGQFDELTRQAVIGFQEKYSSEILEPLNITQGTGFVGEKTRNKLNSLLLNSPTSCVSRPPSPPILVLPKEGSYHNLNPDFVWFSPEDWGQDCSIEGKQYSLRLDDDVDFSSPLWLPGFSTGINKESIGRIPSDPILEYATTYYWRVRAQNGGFYSDWAVGSFRTPLTPNPFVKLKSPNSGEKWQIGQTYSVEWEVSPSQEIMLRLYSVRSDGAIDFFTPSEPIGAVYSFNNKPNTFSWTISYIPGDYFLMVDKGCCHEGELGVEFDYSDSPFTIVAAPSEPAGK